MNMRTPDRILHETWLENGSPIKMDQEKRAWITIAKKAIITAQTEAWNEALEAAAESVEMKELYDKYGQWIADVIDENSILKLMK